MEKDTIKKKQVNKLLELELELNIEDNKEYKVEAIVDNTIYAKVARDYLLELYYLISWKDYLEDESTWEPISTIIYLWKMINIFHKNYLKKPIVTSPFPDSILLIAKLTVKSVKQKHDRSIKNLVKQTKKA